MKKLLWTLAMLMCLGVPQAFSETLYVRPVADGVQGAANGTSYANAWTGTAAIVWGASAGQVGPGDTLCVYGTYTGASESDVSGITLRVDSSGTSAAALVTVDGDCGYTHTKAIFDGNGEVAIGIRAYNGSAQSTYLLVRNIVLKRYTNKAIVTYNVVGDETNAAHQTYDGIEVYNHGDGGAGDNGFDNRGEYVTITNSLFDGIDEDAVYTKGKHFTADHLTVRDVSRANASGDGLQLAGNADFYRVTNFYCDHTKKDSKQCFITSVLSDTGASGIFENATMLCATGAIDQNCAFVTGNGAVIRNIFITGGEYGLSVENSATSTNMRIENVMAVGATLDNITLFGTLPNNIRIANSIAIGAGHRGFEFGPSAITTNSLINSIAMGNAECGINKTNSGQSETYNDSFGNATNYCLISSSASPGTGSLAVNPSFISGRAPKTLEEAKLKPNSPLLGKGGCYLTTGCIYKDPKGNKAKNPPAMGIYQRQ